MKQIFLFTLFLALIILLHSCANKVAPTGGVKDILPPVLVSANPANHQVNFASSEIVLTFNEFIQLKDVQKQVMISPPMNPVPLIELRKRSVIITFKDTLKKNTTYTLNFGKAIADFTEGNALTGFKYVFSTGPVMDSMVIAGILRDALTMKPVSDGIALVYDAAISDTSVGKTSPSYYARTGADGKFLVENVRPGSYRLAGLEDKNNNFTAEPDELVGTAQNNFNLTDSSFIPALLTRQLPVVQDLKSSTRELPGKITTIFVRPVQNLEWKFTGRQPEKVISEFSAYRDTVILYCYPDFPDSTRIIWIENGIVLDTSVYRGEKIKSALKGGTKKVSGIAYPSSGTALTSETTPFVKWTVPLKSFEFFKVKALKDSLFLHVQGAFEDTLQTITSFTAPWEEGTYEITIPPGTGIDLYDRTNDSLKFSFVIPGERTTGSISFNLNTLFSGDVLLQLVNDKDELVRQRKINGITKGVFEKVFPGEYRLRLIFDKNNNGRWDTGELRKGLAPEKVSYYRETVTVRANWEVEVEWKE